MISLLSEMVLDTDTSKFFLEVVIQLVTCPDLIKYDVNV
jgi:hypothetical protein